MTPDPALVIVVDDDLSVQRGLSRLLRSAGLAVETFSSAADFLASGLAAQPGCLVIDLRMPGMNGLELQRAMAVEGHTMPVIFISGEGSIPDTVEAIKAGAVDFLQKPFHDSQLLASIFQALHKDEEIRNRRSAYDSLRERYDLLTPREREVCELVAAGFLNKQIGYQLNVSEKTVKIHRARVMEKLNVRSVPELVRLVDRVIPKSDISRAHSDA